MFGDLKVLIGQRGVVRKKVTESFNRSTDYQTLNASAKLSEKGVLLGYRKSLQDLNALILARKFTGEFSDEDLENELYTCQTYFDKIESCLPLLDTIVSVGSSHSTNVARSLLKQLTAPLPKFLSKEGEDFLKFIAEFESTTSGFEYPDRDLLLLLKQQVEGRGKCLLDSLEADKQKYKDVNDLLISAFASVELRKYSTVKKLTELHLSEGDDPFIFMSNLRTLLVSVQTLDINADEFMKYFAWNGLNDSFKTHIVQITNKTHPSLQDIMDNYFIACERYERQEIVDSSPKNKKSRETKHSESASKEKTSNFAVRTKVENNKPSCQFCAKNGITASDHRNYNCSKFSTPSAKIKILNSFGGCLKCASFHHSTKDCTFRFCRPCSKCSRYHMEYLCKESKLPNSQSSTPKVTQEYTQEVSSGIAVLPNVTADSALPTFTFCIGSHGELYRGLRDTGSQNTFISSKLANLFNFKVVISNVKLTINGFNGSKEYTTSYVEVPVRIDSYTCSIVALVVPSINIRLPLPLLGQVVNILQNR